MWLFFLLLWHPLKYMQITKNSCMMKIKPVILLLLLCAMSNTGAFAQMALDRIEKNANLKQYDHFLEQDAKSIYPNDWIEYELKDGVISSYRLNYKDELGKLIDVFYDKYGRVEKEMLIYDADKGHTREVVFESTFTYDDKGMLVDDGEYAYSKFVKGRPMLVVSREFSEDYKRGSSTIMNYNENGTIRLTKTTFFDTEGKKIKISNYKYDNCGNIAEITSRTTIAPSIEKTKKKKKNAVPPRKPVIEKIEYIYEYNNDCLWIEKYEVLNGVKTLMSQRKFVK